MTSTVELRNNGSTFGPEFLLLISLLKRSAHNEYRNNGNPAITENLVGPLSNILCASSVVVED